MARLNVVNVNTGPGQAELRQELQQRAMQLGEQARQRNIGRATRTLSEQA